LKNKMARVSSFQTVAFCLLLALSVVAATSALIWASPQNPPPAPPPASLQSPAGQAPVFRAAVELVRIDVSVLDRDHKPVHGLTAADFVVREDTKPQTIEAFSEVELPDPVEPTAKWMQSTVHDVTSNELHDSRIVVIVLDDAVIPQDVKMAAEAKAIARDVVNHLGPTDLASVVYTMSNKQKTQGFTTDKGRLLAAVEKFTPGFATFGVEADDYIFYQYSVNVVSDLADYLVALPQRRKTLVYISTGVPLDPAANAPMIAAGTRGAAAGGAVDQREEMLRLDQDLRDSFQRAQRANVGIYPIDPSGLNGVYNFVMNRLLVKRVSAQDAMDIAHKKEGFARDFLLEHADNTGGRATVNTNDYTEGITQIFRENGSYYLLGFRQTDPKGAGKYSRLDVQLKDHPGLEVRARKINYTPKPERALAKASAVTMALAGLLPSPDTPMRVTVAPFAKPINPELTDKEKKTAYGDTTVAIVLAVDEPAPKERVIEHVDLLTRAFTVDGDPRGSQNQTADVTIRAATPLPGEPTPLARYEVLTEITLKPGRYELRLAVDNADQAKTGSVFVDVDVPDFDHQPLSLSGVVLDSVSAPYSAPKDALVAVMPIVPTTDRDFDIGGQVKTFLRVYQGGKSPVAPVTLTTSILDEHDVKVFSSESTLDSDRFAASRSADVTFVLPLDKLKPGAHVLVFEAASGKATARREVVFTVR
jgi:VWFA-related protein